MHCRAKLAERGEMLRHAVAHMPLEAITGMRRAETRHQPVARYLGNNLSRGDRRNKTVAADHGLAVAASIDPITAIDKHQSRHFG
jgi:hypothetical protein